MRIVSYAVLGARCSVCCWFIASLWVDRSFWLLNGCSAAKLPPSQSLSTALSLWFVINMSQLRSVIVCRRKQRFRDWLALEECVEGERGVRVERRTDWQILLTLAGNGRWPRSASCKPEAASDSTTSACDGKWLLTNALLSICSLWLYLLLLLLSLLLLLLLLKRCLKFGTEQHHACTFTLINNRNR